MRLDVRNHSIGVSEMTFALPDGRTSIAQLAEGESRHPGAIDETWRDCYIEPERLAGYFDRERRPIECPGSHATAVVSCASHETAGDLAVRAGRALLSRAPDLRKEVGLVLLCQGGLDEHPTWSNACRLQHDLGLRARAFTVNQVGGAASVIALELAGAALLLEPELSAVMIVTAEKIVAPYPRTLGAVTACGDGASALVVRRADAPAYRALRFETGRAATVANAADWLRSGGGTALVAACADAALRMAGVVADPDRRVVAMPPKMHPHLQHALASRLGEAGLEVFEGGFPDTGSLGAADLAVSLDCASRRAVLRRNDLAIVIAIGLGGVIGCAAFEFLGADVRRPLDAPW